MKELWENSMIMSPVWTRSYTVKDFIQRKAAISSRANVQIYP